MNNLNKYLNTDYFKIGRADNINTVRNINLAALIILGVLLMNTIFFFFVYTTTYYGRLDQVEEVIQDYQNVGHSFFDNMQVGLKIMPSYNTENNVIFMDKTNDVRYYRNNF